MANFLSNSGCDWDNAKKYIEVGLAAAIRWSKRSAGSNFEFEPAETPAEV